MLHTQLVRHVLYPLLQWRRGKQACARYLEEFERTQFLSEEALRELQWQRLASLLEHASTHCPFYRRRFRAAGVKPGDLRRPEDLRALPVLEKRHLQEEVEDLVARDVPPEQLIRNQTGGSTGTPVPFYLTR